VTVSFTDTGIGMSRQVRERLFEPFFTTKSTAGMGLGLAVSYGIIDRHGGVIEVESEPGRGAMFSITLPSIITVSPENTRSSVAGSLIPGSS
jgi:signal transduction histidine kinase